MKKALFLFLILIIMGASLTTNAAAATTITPTPATELGQLKICKVAGPGVAVGTLFTFKMGYSTFTVPAGPPSTGYCVLAGQYPLSTQLTIQEVIPAGYEVAWIEIKPNRSVSMDTAGGTVTLKIGSGVTEAIFNNQVIGAVTSTPTSTPTPTCTTNCPPTPTSVPTGRLQICKEADGDGVTGYFTFKFETRSRTIPVGACAGLISVDAGRLTVTEVEQAGYEVTDVYTIPSDRLVSKDLSAGKAVVTIVEGTAASQTIVVFRNRALTSITSTPTSTATPTSTGSITPTNTPTSTSTSTPTSTGTITSTFTPTPTSTGTITATFTPTPTSTGSITPTNTPTSTPTSTGTITATFTPTATSTGTITATFTPTSTPTSTSTGTVTPTFTPTATGTTTPPPCPPLQVVADFSRLTAGQSVEGFGVVAPFLNIDAKGNAIKVAKDTLPRMYLAPNTAGINGGLSSNGGFSDRTTQQAGQAHLYAFSFVPGVTVSDFSLHMLDFGDLNPTLSINHHVAMTAFDLNGAVVATQELNYTSPPDQNPTSSNIYGNLSFSGDAVGATPGQPGNWTWHVSGAGIARVVLEFGVGYDPNIAFDTITFTTECTAACQQHSVAADFSHLNPGQSLEVLGAVAPYLDIDGKGTAIKVANGLAPSMYLSPNSGGVNGGLAANGGFSDAITRAAVAAHLYTFTFVPGATVSDFSVRMLDFGDLNPTLSIDHHASIVAYDVNGTVIATQELNYTSPAEQNPTSSNIYGDLSITGDATGATPGQPGNWTWHVSGAGIARVVLEFGVGFDPNIAFDNITFITECP